jgi:hypothetical protein
MHCSWDTNFTQKLFRESSPGQNVARTFVTARAAKSAEWPANQAGRREQGVAGLLGVGQVLLICPWGEEIRNKSPNPRFVFKNF